VTALRRTDLGRIDVVELEPGIVEAVDLLHAGRENPLEDPRVRLRVNDGRNELLLERYRGGGAYDVIASQPSHPWLQGAASLFTEEFFGLARENLAEGGVFALWVNGFRTDADSFLAIVASFERVFPGSLLVDGERGTRHASLLLLGGRRPLQFDPARVARRLGQPPLHELVSLFGIASPEDLLAQFHGPTAGFAAIEPEAANTDDNAFVETRIPRRHDWSNLDFSRIEARLEKDAPMLPPLARQIDLEAVARVLLEGAATEGGQANLPRIERLLQVHGAALDAVTVETLRAEARLRDPSQEAEAVAALRALAKASPLRVEPLRALGAHWKAHGRFELAAEAFGEAYALSADPEDAYEAGASWYAVSPNRSWPWFAQITALQRDRFPGLAYFEAERALSRGADPDELQGHFHALERYRDTEEGRKWPGVNDLLARLASGIGEEAIALAYADAHHRERRSQATPLLRRAGRALRARRLEEAERLLARAKQLLPGDRRVTELDVQWALLRGDAAALSSALRELRHFAPSLSQAVARENRLRASRRRPLLPEKAAPALTASDR
jgi:hypothetical protein